MGNPRNFARAVALSTFLAVGVLMPATSAQATPSGCSGRYDLHTYSVYCEVEQASTVPGSGATSTTAATRPGTACGAGQADRCPSLRATAPRIPPAAAGNSGNGRRVGGA